MEVDVSEEDLNIERMRSRFSVQCGDVYNELVEINNAFSGNLKTYYLRNGDDNIKDLCFFLINHKFKIIQLMQNLLTEYGALKFNIVTESTYIKPFSHEIQIRSFKTSNKSVFLSSSIDYILGDMFQKLCRENTEYEGKGSGWTLHSVDGLLIRFSRYRPLRGSSFIPLPKKIALKRAIINPKNFNDNMCFQWSILAKYVNSCVIDKKYMALRNKYNFDGIRFPTPITQIGKFEKLNPGVSVNIYGLDKDENIFPLRVSEREENDHFDLLLLTSTNGIRHYCYIKNFSALVRSQLTTNCKKAVFCKRCFKHYQGVTRFSKLEEHKLNCKSNSPIRVVMPEKDEEDSPPVLKFKNFQHSFKIPIVVYADFECLLTKVNMKESKYTTVNEKHEPMSYCYYVVYDENQLSENIIRNLPNEPVIYRGKDAAPKFMEDLISLTNLIGDLVSDKLVMSPLTEEQKSRFDNATHCEACNSEFTLINVPVRDHCHLTGQFRSVLCNSCNLQRQNQKFLPVYIHGSSHYDSHFIVRQLGCDKKDISVIPNSNEKYVSFSKKTTCGIKIRFLDSFRYLNASLSELACNLPTDQFKHTKLYFNDSDVPLVTRKGVYPYEHTDSWERLSDLLSALDPN